MDSHHDQVMKSREAAEDTASRLYFAYSTILDRAAFEEWRSEHGYTFFRLPEGKMAEAIGVDLVFDFPSRWWRGRVAGLTDKPGASVFGRLFEIGGKDWPIIQHKEGAVTGMSVEREVRVKVDEKEIVATAFTTHPQRVTSEGPVSSDFVEALVRGAKSAGLPASYLDRIGTAAR
jgi:cation transport regulator ChaC